MPKNSSHVIGAFSYLKSSCPCGWQHTAHQRRDSDTAFKRHFKYCLISQQCLKKQPDIMTEIKTTYIDRRLI